MSLSVSKTRLAAITRELSNNWQNTKQSWQDSKSSEFERQYIELLLNNVEKAVTVMDDLEKVLAKIRSDCE
jgi:uncharacterized protein YukE